MRKEMFRSALWLVGLILVAAVCSAGQAAAQCPMGGCCGTACGYAWKIHDMNRPQPPMVDPKKPGDPPSDAIVLFDGKDLSEWAGEDGGPAQWKLERKYMEVVKGAGFIHTQRSFGDCQLHMEWATAEKSEGMGQHRSNSGVFLMGLYEVQVLDCYGNGTYPDGLAGSLYGQYPPLVNACRKPGEWQSYDVVFRRPRFGAGGQLVRPARMTVFLNGVLVQDATTLMGPTEWMNRPPYAEHADKLPLSLQDHGDPVRFRNIWIRELPEGGPVCSAPAGVAVAPADLDRYVGEYKHPTEGFNVTIKKEGDGLTVQVQDRPVRKLIPVGENRFAFDKVGAELTFHVNPDGSVKGLTFLLGGETRDADKIK